MLLEKPTSTEKRTLVAFVLDRSGSMYGMPINQMNAGINSYIAQMQNDENFSQNIEIAITSFDHEVFEVLPPTLAEDVDGWVQLDARGTTKLVDAVNYAVDYIINPRKRYYKEFGLTYTRAFLVVITDGAPDPDQDVQQLKARIEQETKDGRYLFLALGVENADRAVLDYISGYVEGGRDANGNVFYKKVKPMILRDVSRFGQFFEFIEQSSKTMSSEVGTAAGSDGISASSFPDWLTQ